MRDAFSDFWTDNIMVTRKGSGSPSSYMGRFDGAKMQFILPDENARVGTGDRVALLVGGGSQNYFVKRAYSNSSIKGSGIPSHWVLELSEKDPSIQTAPVKPTSGPTYNISNHGALQIGDHNRQEVQQVFRDVVEEIDKSPAPEEQKAEAKGLLRTALEHPVTLAIVSAGAAAAIDAIFRSQASD